MSDGGWGNPFVGGTVLRYPALQSPNYVSGVSGWFIGQDGSSEYNNLTIRGTFSGNNYEVNASGLFFYSPSKGLGNLVVSVTGANGGTDQYGNVYQPGVSVYGANNSGVNMVPSGNNTALAFTPGVTPAAIAGIAELYGALSGTMQLIDGQDGTSYGTARRTLTLGSNSGSLTGLSNIFTSPVAPGASNRTYRVHAQLIINGTSGAQVNCNLSVPSLVSGSFAYTVSRGAFTAFGGTVAGTPNTAAGLAISLGTATGYVMTLDGEFTISGSGTFALQLGSITATGLVVAAGSLIDIMPV